MDEQAERLARAELRALRAQISPHFIYNALAAIAGYIHSNPEEARELLTEFAEFTRYAFRGQRPYVTLADELHYVEKYLRLEQARFGERLQVRVQVAPEVLPAVVPGAVAAAAGRERGPPRRREARLRPDRDRRRHLDADVELRVTDDGVGHGARNARGRCSPGRAAAIGLANVQARLQSTFGPATGSRSRAGPVTARP